MDSNKSFPVMSIHRIVLAAFEILRHMLEFRSSVSCLGFGRQTFGWAICITTSATNFVSRVFGCERECLLCFGLLGGVLTYYVGIRVLVIDHM